MTARVEKTRARIDGIYRRARATIVSEYAYRPVRFFSIFLAFVIGLGMLAYYGPIRAHVNELIASEPDHTTTLDGQTNTEPNLPTVSLLAKNSYFSNDEITLASDVSLKLPLTQSIVAPEVEIKQAISGEVITEQFTISTTNDGKSVEVKPVDQVRAGRYEVTAKNPNSGQVIAQKTVSWGVLAFNSDYAVYPANTEANFAMAVLDDRGKMVCGADMTLEISDPRGKTTTLSIKERTIINSPDCLVYGPTTEPDYYAKYQTNTDGEYKVRLVAAVGDGKRTLEDNFFVKSNQDFYLKRSLPTRIYPPITYDVRLTLEARKAGHYTVTEGVPSSFEVSKTKAKVNTKDSSKTLRWEFDAEANQSQDLTYSFKAPNISPYLFIVGPAKVTVNDKEWQEPRSWQIASDTACTSNGTGGGNWSAGGSWDAGCGGVPQVADTIQILNGDTITEDTASVTVAGVTIDVGGILTVSTTNAITVSGNWSNSGTFTAASGTVTFSATATGKTLSGTMTGATGKFYNVVFSGSGGGWTLQAAIEAANDFTVSAGTFDTKSGSNFAVTVTNDLSITGGTFTARNSTITVSRHWTLNTGATFTRGGSTVVLDGTGSILGTALTQFESLSIGYSTKTTTLAGSNNRVDTFGTFTLNGGTVTTSATYSFYMLKASAGTYSPLVFASATTLSGTSVTLYYRTIVTGITINVAAGDYGTWNVSPYASAGNSNTWNFAGDVTTTGTFQPFAATGITGTSVNTQNFALTAKRLSFGATGANLGPIALSLGSSAVTLSNGTSDAILMANVAVTHTLDMGSSSIDVKGNVLFVNGSASVTVTPGTSTLTWTNTSGTLTYAPNGQSLYNLILNGSGSTVAPNAAVDIDNDLTMTAGTLNGTQNITVNGTVAGSAGIISLTGGTFEQRVAAAENFGTTSGSTAWTFSTLTFSNSSGSAVTITTQTTGSGGITISSTLNVGKAADTAKTVFNAGNRTYTMSSTAGNPIIADADGNGSSITGSTSTFSLTGANASGNTTIEKNTGDSYYNLTLNASDTFVLEGATTATGAVTITTGTLDTVAGSNYALTAGTISIATSQTLTANNSTITLTGTSGTLFTRSGTFTQGDSTVIVTSASGTPTLLSAATTFHILTINAAATVVNAGAAITTDDDAGNKFYVQTGVFNLEGQTITPGTSGTLEVSSTGTFCLGGTTSATTATCDSGATQTSASTFPAFTTVTLNATSTVIFLADVAQTVTNTPTYGNLTLKPKLTAARIYTMGGAMTINGNFDITPDAGSALALTVNSAGTITVATTKTTTITGTTSATSIVDLRPVATDYDLSTGFLNIASVGLLDASDTTSATLVTLTGTSGTLWTQVGNFRITSATSTVVFIPDATVTLTSGVITFYNLTLSPTITTDRTYTFGAGALTINGSFTINPTASSALALTVNMGAAITVATTGTTTVTRTTSATATLDLNPGSSYNLSTGDLTISTGGTLDGTSATSTITVAGNYSNSGTFTAGSTTVTFSATDIGNTIQGTLSGSTGKFYNVIFGVSGSPEWTPNAAVEISNDLTMTAGSLLGTQNVTVNGHVAGTAGVINLTGGTFEQRVAANKNFGTTSGSTAWTFSSLTFSNSCSALCSGLTITTQTDGSGGITVSSILLVGKSGDAVGATTTLDAGNRTWTLSGTAGDPFQILASPAGVLTGSTSTFTYTGNNGAGNTTVQTATYYNLDINNSSETFVLEGTTGASNDLTATAGTLDTTASNHAVNVTRDMTINGTFTANASTITVSRNWTFNTGATLNRGTSTVAMNGDGSILGSATTQFQNLSIGSSTKTTTLAATTNRTDAFGTLTVNGGTVTSSATYSVYLIKGAGTYTPFVFASATTLSGASVTLIFRTIAASGIINVAAGDYGTWNIENYPSVGNSSSWTLVGTVTTTGQYYLHGGTGITGSTFSTGNQTLTAKSLVIGNSSDNAAWAVSLGSSTITLSNGTSDVLSVASNGGSHTLDMSSAGVSVKGNVKFVNGTGAITVTPGTSTLTWTNTSGTLTYSPNGQSLYNMTLNGSGSTVAPDAAVDVNNNFTITAGSFTAPSSMTIGGDYSNSGTFTHSSGTVTFDATDTGNTLGGTLSGSSAFYNLIFSGSGGEWTPSATVAVSNDLTMTAGSLLGTQNLTVAGGDITGDGTINLTGGTTTLTADGNFGGATAWTFYTLKFGNTSSLVPVETVTATGAGGITVTDVLTINKHSGLGCDENTLNAGSKIWTLSGTTGSPLVVDGTLTPSTSTITITGNNGSGNTNVPGSGAACGDATYNNLTLNNGSETFAVSGTTNITINSNLTITAGTFTAGSGTTTVKGNLANSGTFTANSGNVTLSGTSTQTISGTLTGGSAFYDLTISNSSGTDASDCELTSWVAGIDFAVAATVTNNYTITTASVRVEYNSGSTYTINNMNWNGQAVGTRLYFRNSAATGTWLLNVTAIGNQQTKVSYINVSRSDASGGATIIASDGTNTDCGSNVNWQFDESLTLSLDSTSKDFGVVTPGSNPSDQTTTLTATSNAVNGYVIYGWTTQAMTNVRFGGVTLADWTGTNATPTTFSAGSYGFGYTTDDASLTGGTADRFTSGGAKYAGFTHSGPGDPVADRTAPATSATNTINYRLYPSATQADGDYTTIVIYVIAAQFP